MELLKTQEVSSVTLFDMRLSESEIESYAIAFDYLLHNLTDQQLHAEFNEEKYQGVETPAETRRFLSALFEDLLTLLEDHCQQEYLPPRLLRGHNRPSD